MQAADRCGVGSSRCRPQLGPIAVMRQGNSAGAQADADDGGPGTAGEQRAAAYALSRRIFGGGLGVVHQFMITYGSRTPRQPDVNAGVRVAVEVDAWRPIEAVAR